jgi:hypothetical protein
VEDYNSPKNKDKKDKALVVAKSITSLIPIVGAPANELLDLIITPSLQNRRDKWLEDVGQSLRDHENRISSLESLLSNDHFIDIAMEASRIAISTSQNEVRESLKNCLINVATAVSPNKAKNKLFLSFLDSFTEYHILFLKLFDDPNNYLRLHKKTFGNLPMGGIKNLLDVFFPELIDDEEFSRAIWNDLNMRKLLNTPDFGLIMSGNGILLKRTTELADEFLIFISKPSTTK